MSRLTSAAVVVLLSAGVAWGQVAIDTVTVGDPGNTGELSGAGAGGWGADRICGSVDYVYNIGTFEVTAGQYTEFLNAVAATDTYGLYNPLMDSYAFGCQITQNGTSGSYTYDFSGRPSGTEADWADRPVNYVSWGDVARFCNWMHNGQLTGAQDLTTTEDGSYHLNGATTDEQLIAVVREPDATWVIPSEDEWYKAAYYDGGSGVYYDYPTSTDSVPGYVNNSGNLSGTGTAFTEGGTDPGNYATYDDDGGTDGIGSPYYRTEVGGWENSESPFGTFDQGGNVWEWNEAAIGSFRGFRGGSFGGGGHYLRAAYRNYYSSSNEIYNTGFRVAVVVPPVCGNAVVDTGEACDDGSLENGDGCSSTCAIEPGWVCAGEPSICIAEGIPTVSEWGMLVMVALMLTAGGYVMKRRTVTA